MLGGITFIGEWITNTNAGFVWRRTGITLVGVTIASIGGAVTAVDKCSVRQDYAGRQASNKASQFDTHI